ncbi:MAG: putative adhesin, partial [Bacteroidota bacterium]
IEGEVNQSFFPKLNGKYAAIIATPDCKDTSDCYSFSLLSFERNSLKPNFTIFPNPCSRILIISNASKIEKLEFINSVGQKIYTCKNYSEQIQLDVSDFVPGLYSIEIHSEKGVFTSRIIIKKSD